MPLAVVNQRQVCDVAGATGYLTKTDRLDAAAIALFTERVRPAPAAAGAEAQALAGLVARRRQIGGMIGMTRYRRGQGRSERVRQTIEATLKALKAQLTASRSRKSTDSTLGMPASLFAERHLKHPLAAATVTSTSVSQEIALTDPRPL